MKEALDIPVIGSGDVFSPLHVKKMFDETGCDGVAIARGALGNPWIFRETAEFLKTGIVPPRPDNQEVADIMTAHLRAIVSIPRSCDGACGIPEVLCLVHKGVP